MLVMLNEYITNGYKDVSLNLSSIFSILAGVFIIISKNPIVSILFLIALFLSISCYLITLGINFLGLSYLLVYIGAISILFLFILMLINIRVSEIVSDTNNSIPLIIIIGILSGYFFNEIYSMNNLQFVELVCKSKFLDYILTYSINNYNTFFITSTSWDGGLVQVSHITSIGNIMYTSYSILLLLTSLILLLAMIGTIVITIKHKNG